MRTNLLAIALFALMAAAGSAQDSTVYDAKTDGVTLPQPTRQVKAQYTAEAMRQMIEGDVLLAVVVTSDGAVGDVTVKESLDAVYGLDQEAVTAMKQWQFKPGTKDGKPVNVRVEVKMRFTLK
ncbi:MAG TPA: energy transducer TonB [Vicinamibacterales bacterium]|nr:energy transducer TonB [Vicinamibacterales bacterium]